MENQSPRFAMPQLAVAQAHKEITHNEALAVIDAVLHPSVEALSAVAPAATSQDAGKCWIVGTAATGIFANKSGQIAYWTGSSWRFVQPVEGMRVWHRGDRITMVFLDQQWQSCQSIALPTGGNTIDVEARAALSGLIGQLVAAGILAAG